jgi:hypothetical protein
MRRQERIGSRDARVRAMWHRGKAAMLDHETLKRMGL